VLDDVRRRQDRKDRRQDVPRQGADAVAHHRDPDHIVEQEEVRRAETYGRRKRAHQLGAESFQTLTPTADHPRDRKGSENRGEQIGIIQGEDDCGGEQKGVNDLGAHLRTPCAVIEQPGL